MDPSGSLTTRRQESSTWNTGSARRDACGARAGALGEEIEGRNAYFANAYTLEECRRRGCQGALLAARLHDAAELGVTLALTDVVAGSVSERNCLRAGFERAEAVTIWRGAEPVGG